MLTALTVTALLLAILALIARTQAIANIPTLVLAVGSPYASVAAVAGFVLAASCRRRVLSIAAVVVLVASLAVQISWYYLGRPSDVGAYQDIRVLSRRISVTDRQIQRSL